MFIELTAEHGRRVAIAVSLVGELEEAAPSSDRVNTIIRHVADPSIVWRVQEPYADVAAAIAATGIRVHLVKTKLDLRRPMLLTRFCGS